MAVDPADVEAVCAGLDAVDADELAPLTDIAAVLAYACTDARLKGFDEADQVEMVCKAGEVRPDDMRAAAAILGALGYRLAADRLKELAGRKRGSALPPGFDERFRTAERKSGARPGHKRHRYH